ncbi:MAG: (Fe-S)-binding protein [Candidatus Buchananbacteria bacterium]|jgi:Fe-S oxidoreductase
MSFFDKILSKSGNILYYPGCLTKFVAKDIFDNYKKLLEMSGEDFIVLPDHEVCCGSPVLNAGFPDDFKNLAEKNLALFKEYNVKKIITGCPACYEMFRNKYKEVLSGKWDIDVEHMTTYLLRKLKEGKLKLAGQKIKATYHDPCHLGRYGGIYEEPREILKLLGVDLQEMVLNREFAFCCGAGGGVQSNNKELAESIAAERVSQALATDAEYIITPCPMCAYNLRNGARLPAPEGAANGGQAGDKMKVVEFSDVLLGKI